MNFEGDKATLEWLNAQKASTRSSYKWNWSKFLEMVEMTGDEIIESRKNDEVFHWEKVVYDTKVALEQKFSSGTAKAIGTAARSFFAYHRSPLQFRRQEKKRLTEASVVNEDYRFSVDDLRAMAAVANLTEKYVLIVGKSIGLRDGDFRKLTRGDLEPYIDREAPVSIGKLNTGKENVPAYPFLDSDAVEVVKLMLKAMNSKGKTAPETKMVSFHKHSQTSLIVRNLVKRAGINVGNKRTRFHCLRKFLIDRLSSFMSESKWKQICGKKIKESAYVSPDSLREDFKRAMPQLVIKKQEVTGDVEAIAKKQVLLMFARNVLKLSGKKVNECMREAKNISEEIAALEGIMNEPTPTKLKACADGQHCSRIVDESELEAMLATGWKFVSVLPSGKILVSND